VCIRERAKRKKERERDGVCVCLSVCVHVCRERDQEKKIERERVCVRERVKRKKEGERDKRYKEILPIVINFKPTLVFVVVVMSFNLLMRKEILYVEERGTKNRERGV